MAKIEWVHHRLERWALWKSKGGSLSGASSSCAMWQGVQVDRSDRHDAPIPIDEIECGRTDGAIKALPVPLSETLASYYLQDSERTRKRMGISSSLLSQRIDQAHRLLVELFGAEKKPMALHNQMPAGWLRK
jgi:hypothetical protein